MTGEKQIGGFVWKLGVKSTVKQDLEGAKAEVNGFDDSVTGASDSLMVMDAITKQNARDIRQMSSGVAIAGGMMMGLSTSAKIAGIDLGVIGDAATGAGMSFMMLGTTVASITPLMRAYAAFQSSELILGLKSLITVQTVQTAATIDATAANVALAASGYSVSPSMVAMASAETTAAAATITLAGALTVLAAATVIGAVIVGAYLLYTAWDKAQQGARDLEKAVKSLNQEMDILNQVSKSQTYESGLLSDALDNNKRDAQGLSDTIRDLTDELDDYNKATKDAKGLTNDLASAENRLKSYTWDRKDAQEALAKARTPEDRARAQIALNDLKIRHDADLLNIQDLKDRKAANDAIITSGEKQGGKVGLEQKLSEYIAKQSELTDRMTSQQERLNGLKEKELATNQQLAEMQFEKFFLEMKRPLTEEEMKTFSSDPNSPAAKALKRIPPTLYQSAEYGMINPDGTFTEGHAARTIQNPLFDTVGLPQNDAPGVGKGWTGQPIVLKLDGTFNKNEVRGTIDNKGKLTIAGYS